MPWNKTDFMNERIKFIAKYLENEYPFSDLCSQFEVSRKTGYKWIERYEAQGVQSLADRSRAPLTHPQAINVETINSIIAIRKRHPHWGPKKLAVLLKRQDPRIILPATSTIGEILKRNGLVKKRKRTRSSSPYGERLREYAYPNSVWCADFKGHFATGKDRCHPLTITDGFSRYLLKCHALPRPLYEPTRRAFENTFREYGLPETIRTDNGAPFSTLAPGGLSRLAIWWIKLGIRPERIMPGRPEQNGRHERMHSTLKTETAKPPKASLRAQQIAFNDFITEYNTVRPHEALDQNVPSHFYVASARKYPDKLPEVEYPSHFLIQRAYPNGVITIDHTQWYISGCLRNELVGAEEVDNDTWKIYFGPIPLGIIDARNAKDKGNRHFGKLIRIDGDITQAQRRRKV
jgi:transposase InsO family protein